MNVLITGITGFVGKHLLNLLRKERPEWNIYGTYRSQNSLERMNENIRYFHPVECNLVDASSVFLLIKESKPDYIFHLAGESSVFFSWKSPSGMVQTNVIGQINLFEAIRELEFNNCIFLSVGSSEEYGIILPNNLPITKEKCLAPISPYAVTKAAQDLFGFQYYKSFGTKIIRTRSFNHTGPGRNSSFALSGFAHQLVCIEQGKSEPVIKVGNLNARRDFLDVRDVVKAYLLLVENGNPGEVYNICRGESYLLADLLEQMIQMSLVRDIKIAHDPDRMRPVEIPEIYGSNDKIRKAVGWQPVIPFKQTLLNLLEYWRSTLANKL